MTIILFLIDTSASMSQEAYVNGVHKTYLDIAKGAVETFLKYRQRSQDCLGDRYMLLTFEDPPSNIKAGWKENHATFMNELKNLQSNGLTSMGDALKSAFDLLNLNRMQSGIDTYGQGRCPFYLEPSIIILITDGGKFSFRNGVSSEFVLPININIPGFKLTKEPFRWDQRLFSLVLRMSGNKGDERIEGTNTWKVPHDDSAIEKMCEVTGGRSYRVRTQYVLNQCIESLVQKAQPGVVVNFESIVNKELKDGEVQDLMFQNTKKMIYVHKIPALKSFPVGYWPIPESYFPDVKMSTLPPRDAHPRIKIISPCQDEPQTVRNFPIDKYELEASPLTLQILSRKDPNKVWPLLVVNSNNGAAPPMPSYRYDEAPSSYRGNATNDMPFGYLKAHNSLTVVHFYVLPYNYQFLLPLISDLVHKLNNNPTSEWINKFATYVKNMPQYYVPFLRRALTMINIPYQLLQYILPESLDNYLSAAVANSLKQMKNKAKIEQESLCLHVFKQLKLPRQPYHQHETVKLNCGLPLKIADLVRHPMLKDTFQKLHSEINTYDNYNIVVPTVMSIQSTKNYRNPFDIPRRDLIDEISRMRDNFFKLPTCNINLVTKDAGHSLPIAEMGNYQEYLKRRETPLRELEPTNVRQHMFGNPYKRDKHMVMVDEADVHEMASDPSSMNNKSIAQAKKDIRMSRKRKAGPIRKDYIYKRARFDFGYPMSPGLPCAPSPLSSDAEDDTASESGSMFTDDNDDSRSMSDFSELSNDEYRMNGHMQEYGAGFEMHDPNDMPMEPTTPPPPLPAPFVHAIQPTPIVSRQLPNYSINHQQPSSQLNNNSPHFLGSHHFNQQTPPIGSTPVLPLPLSLNGDMTALQIPAIGSPVVQSVPTSPTTPPPPFPTIVIPATSSTSSSSSSTILSSRLLNDMNDVQNISNILKTCQNGSGSSKGGNHHNNNSSHDKFNSRLENDSCDRLTNNNNNSNNCNSKEINENSIDDKLVKSEEKPPTTGRQQHRQSKVKSVPTSKSNSKSSSSSSSSSATTTTTTTVPATTNGLVNNRTAIDSKSKNCLKSVNLNHTNNKTTNNNNSSNNNNNNSNNNNSSSKTTTTIKSSALLPVENGDDTETLDGDEIKTQNQETRTIVFKDIRKYGRDYGSLYEHLGLVKGNFDTRFNFIRMCIDEATRFRRKRMADCIQEWWENSLDKVSKSKT